MSILLEVILIGVVVGAIGVGVYMFAETRHLRYVLQAILSAALGTVLAWNMQVHGSATRIWVLAMAGLWVMEVAVVNPLLTLKSARKIEKAIEEVRRSVSG
jgi:hypothetical protein